MKKLMPALLAALSLLCIYFAFSFSSKGMGEVDLCIKNVEAGYTFKISFYSGATQEVTTYMDSCVNILQKENARLHIKISEGNLTITADKQANSAAAMARIRDMCHRISDHLIQY